MKTWRAVLTVIFAAAAIGQTAKSPGDQSPIYIPADKRHTGLSRYDLIPFTDRLKGDPDRYRAVNPNYVRREAGHYFYSLTAKSRTHLYDESLKDIGALTETNVEVDLTQTKNARSATGKDIKYVFIKNKGYVPGSAIEQSPEDIRNGRWFLFPIKAGEHSIYDGTGIERGRLATKSVKLNYGSEKQIGGEKYYYAFSTRMITGTGTIGVSGWIKASSIANGNDPQFDATFVSKMQVPTTPSDRFTRYAITGGNAVEKIGVDAAGKAIYRFGYTGKNGDFVAYKVLPRIPLDGKQSVAATDYLERSDNVINLGFNPAGVSNDTFRVIGPNRPLTFFRSSEKDATVEIDLFYPRDDKHSGDEVAGKMLFVYGYLAVPGDKRWGWIPLAALRPVVEP